MKEWHRYYSEKRIGQQWKQLDLVGRYHKGGEVLEVGPYLGLVTACLVNAGYEVTTFDAMPRQFSQPETKHIQGDLRALDPQQIKQFKTVLCCETLEHLAWDAARDVLVRLRAPARVLIVSVPYEGLQLFAQLYLNRHAARQMFQWRKMRSFRRFPMSADENLDTHKWEVGYLGHSLSAWENAIRGAGWSILAREFTSPTRSVFHVLV